jgi:hypothetical protein
MREYLSGHRLKIFAGMGLAALALLALGGTGAWNPLRVYTSPADTADANVNATGQWVFSELMLKAATEVTVSSGAITVTQMHHTVDGEGDLSDNLDTITWSGVADGQVLWLRPANAARDITVRHNQDNIYTPSGVNYQIPDNAVVQFMYSSGASKWLLAGASDMSMTTYDADANGKIDAAAGGTNISTASSTGLPILSTGTWSIAATVPLTRGGLAADVSAYAGLVKISGGAASAVTITAAGEAILDDADAATQRTTLGLGTIATQNANAVAITGGTINGATVGASTPAAGTFTALGLPAATELTISGGVITITQSLHRVDGQGDLDDNLDTINGGASGRVLLLYPENAARNITLRHGTGNIVTGDGANYTIPDNGLVLLAYDGSNWRMVAGTGGGTVGSCTFTFTIADDGDDDNQHFEVEIDDDPAFGSPAISWDTRPTEDGTTGCRYFNGTQWTDWPVGGVTAAYEGQRGSYSFAASSITAGTLYYCRIRFHDGTGFGPYAGDMKTWQ